MDFIWVFLGGGIGSAARHGVNVLVTRLELLPYPAATLLVNVLGSFFMGVVVEYWALKSGLPQSARLFLTTGVLGGFTTFSAFSLEVVHLNARGGLTLAGIYVAASIVLGLGALYAGISAARWAA